MSIPVGLSPESSRPNEVGVGDTVEPLPLQEEVLEPLPADLKGALDILKGHFKRSFPKDYVLKSGQKPEDLVLAVRQHVGNRLPISNAKLMAYWASGHEDFQLAAQIAKAATLDEPPEEALKKAGTLLTWFGISKRQFERSYGVLQQKVGSEILPESAEAFEADKTFPERVGALLDRLKSVQESTFSEEKLEAAYSGLNKAESVAAKFLTAASLLKGKESITHADAFKRADGRLAKHGKGPGFLTILFCIIIFPIGIGILLAYGPWKTKKIAKWEGVQAGGEKNLQKTFLENAFKGNCAESIMLDPWNPKGKNIGEKRAGQEWRAWIERQLTFTQKTVTAFDETLVLSTGGKSPTRARKAVSQNQKILESLRNFYFPDRTDAAQNLQLNWYTPEWNLIREKIDTNDLQELKASLKAEKKRLVDATDSGQAPYVREAHIEYIDALQQAFLRHEADPGLFVHLEETEGANFFEKFLSGARIPLPDTYLSRNEERNREDMNSFKTHFGWGVGEAGEFDTFDPKPFSEEQTTRFPTWKEQVVNPQFTDVQRGLYSDCSLLFGKIERGEEVLYDLYREQSRLERGIRLGLSEHKILETHLSLVNRVLKAIEDRRPLQDPGPIEGSEEKTTAEIHKERLERFLGDPPIDVPKTHISDWNLYKWDSFMKQKGSVRNS